MNADPSIPQHVIDPLVDPLPNPIPQRRPRILRAPSKSTFDEPVVDYSGNYNIPIRDDAQERRDRMKLTPLSPSDKDRLYRRKLELENLIKQGMPTHTEMWIPSAANVDKLRRWERTWFKEIEELKKINRRLDPDNPSAGRIEYLRKQGEADKLADWRGPIPVSPVTPQPQLQENEHAESKGSSVETSSNEVNNTHQEGGSDTSV